MKRLRTNATLPSVSLGSAAKELNLPDLLNHCGLSDGRLISVLAEELKATKRHGNRIIPDWNARHRALELALKLRGLLDGPLIKQDNPVPILNIIRYAEPDNRKDSDESISR